MKKLIIAIVALLFVGTYTLAACPSKEKGDDSGSTKTESDNKKGAKTASK